MLAPGNTIGSCLVQAPLGIGGMATVYRGWDPRMGRPVAIKDIKPELVERISVREHFEHGATALAALQHTHIVRIYDLIVTRDTLAMVMELIEGPSLEQILRQEHPPPWNLFEAMAVMSPVLSAMAYAHRVGMVHRDLKPANILLDRSTSADWPGIAKVIDFDLVKLTDHMVGADAGSGARMGTVPYMAPEQYTGQPDLDARAYVFALGVLLRQLLTGALPVEDPTDEAQIRAFYRGGHPLDPIRDRVPSLPRDVSDAIDASMALDPRERPATAAELLALLGSRWGSSPPQPSLQSEPPSTAPPPPPDPEGPISTPTNPPTDALVRPRLTSIAHPTAVWAAAAGVGAIGFLLLMILVVSC